MSLDDFLKSFKSTWGAVTAAAAAGPLLMWTKELQPPWPEGVSPIASLFCAIAILVGYALSRLLTTPHTDRRAEHRLLLAGSTCLLLGLVSAAIYLWAYSSRVVSETMIVRGGEATVRFVIGTELLPNLVHSEAPDIERLRDYLYEPALIWTAASLRTSRLILLASFLVTFFLLTLGSCLLTQFGGKAAKAART